MRTVISTELLLRLMNATPEQYAAVERILTAVAVTKPAPPVTMEVATAAFAMMLKLQPKAKHRAPTPLTVFKYYCIEKMSAKAVAKACRCAKGTVMSRLRFIQDETKTKPEQFRAMSGHLQRIADDYKNSKAEKVFMKRVVQESGPDEYADQ